jgi:hypothetical protein
VTCRLDHRKYPVGRRITDEEFMRIDVQRDKIPRGMELHSQWQAQVVSLFIYVAYSTGTAVENAPIRIRRSLHSANQPV